jgi:hypothetical protein
MKDKKLIRVNGQIQSESTVKRRKVTNSDIPDYDKVKAPVNPMEPVVAKIEAQGWTALDAYAALDFDEDGVLTIDEIRDGLVENGVRLTAEEWQLLHQAIDENHDGVLTQEEWCRVLEPKISAHRQFIDLMENIAIDDPLDLEERILDIQFKKRRLDNELRQMRK